MNLNKAQLIGRVTRDPEMKALPSGTKVVKFGLATNNVFKDKAGEKKESTQFHNCVAFGRIAETIGQYVVKGQEIYVEGRIEYRDWEGKDGVKRNSTEIIVENFQFGQRAKSGGAEKVETSHGASGVSSEMPTIDVTEGEIKAEDLPF